MSKLSFRARALDAAKPLPIYRNGDIPDLNDCVSINRAVPQMPTGMEKEEESEHHLQRAICAQQVFREKRDSMVIPVPEVEGSITYYDRLYKGDFRQTKQLIHIQPFGLDNEQPDYDMDSEDEMLLNRLNRKMELKPLQFEVMVDRLEKASGNQLVTLQEAKLLLNEDDYLLKSVYDYWVRKRKNCRGPSLTPQVKQEKRDGSTNNDAYVAFRRRTEKMQTRKNRKNDEASYEKMLKLRREFSRTVTILEMIKKREKSKRELLHLTLEVVEKRYQMGDFSGEVLKEVSAPLAEKAVFPAPVCLPNGNRHKMESKIKTHKQQPSHPTRHLSAHSEPRFDFTRPHRKYGRRPRLDAAPRPPGRPPQRPHAIADGDIKQYDFHSSGEEDSPLSPSSEPDEENDPDGAFIFRRRDGCHYLAPLGEQRWCSPPGLAWLADPGQRNSLTALSVPRRWVGVSHRRLGRGGRIVLDRTSSDLDRALRLLDPDVFCPSTASVTHHHMHTDTHVNAATHTPPAARTNPQCSLAQLLSNIQACRVRYFRPRPLHENGKEGSKKDALQHDDRKGRGTFAVANNSRTSLSGGITEEQFQSHQQQLEQMKQQQIAQSIHQQGVQPQGLQLPQTMQHIPALPERSHSHVTTMVSTDSVSKTLDSASAHFAASAVVSAPNQESKPHRAGINGILPCQGPRQTKFGRPAAGASSTSSVRPSGGPPRPAPGVPQSLPHGLGPLSSVSAVSPAHAHHSARPCAPSPPALKLASVASSPDHVPRVAPGTAISSLARDKHEPERLALNGMAETTVAMEVT
ncbi:enhancer of polycomb homolog 2 isoform X1 [Electrophorus electricus]|uniref:Enhancer of polycomb homolog n=1 Tax=Electrophorus electricus TaxID=8005 RepID=A0A4W4F901_ELEEL|nr:enhancer of polycomb homolog 2 isoform X1 [Electrophorus electricus]